METQSPHDLIIIDIETASCVAEFEDLTEEWQQLFADKTKYIRKDQFTAAEFYPQRAGVMAEFSKVICISMGYFLKEEQLKLRVKSYHGHDEKKLLSEFIAVMDNIRKHSSNWHFAGHNIKEFDIPFLCRRLIINELPIPDYLNFQNKKPWETNIIDTLQYWRFGDYKNYTSLRLLSAALGLPSPKDDIDGSKVGEVYWKNRDLKRISIYCQKDVVTVANIFLRLQNIPLLHHDDVELV